MRHVIAIDQGTTGSTVLVLDERLQVRGRGYQEFRQIYPRPGWVEHDPDDIWASVCAALAAALTGIDPQSIAAIGITNQRETTVVWDRKTGKAIHNAIVWQDRRTAGRCAELTAAGHAARVRELTGLTLDPYFSGTKLRWLLDHVPGAGAAASAGDLAFGTVDCTSCGGSPAVRCTRPMSPTRRARCSSISTSSRGPTSCSRCSACRAASCRASSRRRGPPA